MMATTADITTVITADLITTDTETEVTDMTWGLLLLSQEDWFSFLHL
jgi:hypothetical protein